VTMMLTDARIEDHDDKIVIHDERTFLGELWRDLVRVFAALACVALLTLFIALLIAPALEPILCRDLRRKVCGGTYGSPMTEVEIRMADKKLFTIRVILWITAILAWITLFVMNNVWNFYGV